MTKPFQLRQRLWKYCNILRDDGLSYVDYVEPLTYLFFLKLADETMVWHHECSPLRSTVAVRSEAGIFKGLFSEDEHSTRKGFFTV